MGVFRHGSYGQKKEAMIMTAVKMVDKDMSKSGKGKIVLIILY